MEERKQYFEPQVLKIEDNVDYQPLLSDNEYENYQDDNLIKRSASPSSTKVISDSMSAISVSSNLLYNETLVRNRPRTSTSSSSLRPKTAFKQSFDYDEVTELDTIVTAGIKKNSEADASAEVVGAKTENSAEQSEKKKRSKSRDRHGHHHHNHHRKSSVSKRSPSPSSSFSFNRDSASESRVTTGDTGYSSSASSLSSLRLKSLESGGYSALSHHQPIIVSSNLICNTTSSLNSSSFSLLQSTMHTNNIKPLNNYNLSNATSHTSLNHNPHQTPSLTSLKQLKTNLAPLSGPIKLPSNNKL